ncbi:Leech-derived tryptase inhibitor C [Orchesella cincta]|uniref:Leech-derived tryptase inhibitor C n=1 Tax=Orchesella cincta TaxID=48709 RepID=A0A1D2MS14_ORCCI|nr:Leech-derived tryptase inhibitor C [Orchesella cincta]
MKLFILVSVTTAIFLMALVSESQGEEEVGPDESSGRFLGSYGFGGGGRGRGGSRQERKQHRADRRGRRRGILLRLLGLGPPPEPVERIVECDCPLVVKYVCGSNNKTYENECELNCQEGIELAHPGSCEDPSQDEPNPLHSKVNGDRKKHEGTKKPKIEGEESSSSSESDEGGSTSTAKPEGAEAEPAPEEAPGAEA